MIFFQSLNSPLSMLFCQFIISLYVHVLLFSQILSYIDC